MQRSLPTRPRSCGHNYKVKINSHLGFNMHFVSHFLRLAVGLCLLVSLANRFAFAQSPPAVTSTPVPMATVDDTAEQRLAYMKQSGEMYDVTLGDDQTATFRSDPLLRFTNPVSGVVDGGLFIWQSEAGRPVAIAQLFIAPGTEKLWIHEFQSLADRPLEFKFEGLVVWSPSRAGVKFQPVANAAAPSPSPIRRLLQMRQIARRLSVQDDFEGADADELRLLAKPLVRYQDDATVDGALFTYAHGTDPELLVLIEARKPIDGPEDALVWRIALAPMTSYAITAKLDEQLIWSVPWRQAPHPTNAIFKNFVFPPNPADG